MSKVLVGSGALSAHMQKLIFRKCDYCKQDQLFYQRHIKCINLKKMGEQLIISEIFSSIIRAVGPDELEDSLKDIEKAYLIPQDHRKDLLITGWEKAIEMILEKRVFDEFVDQRICAFMKHFCLTGKDLDRNGLYTKMIKVAILQKIRNGEIPSIMTDGNEVINLERNEKIVWAFENSDYLEDQTERQYLAGSRGISIRVMKGVSYRIGSHTGHTIKHTKRVYVDTGWIIITNKNIYFSGKRKNIKLPYKKIISFEEFIDGISITRDATTAKPQSFITGDGSFTHELVTSLARM